MVIMDAGFVSALAALAGSVIGGMTSLAASWLSQHTQVRAQQIASDKTRLQTLYADFIEEASKGYADALVTQLAEASQAAKLVRIYALESRIRVLSSPSVRAAGQKVMRMIVETYLAPNKTISELRNMLLGEGMDPLQEFSEACRDELQRFGPA
ncbi:MAG TPA: hypothetical protein VKM54_16625 [Myxococcota bacterium]|nr:hypothetical protein [Myxococcota bacterium]